MQKKRKPTAPKHLKADGRTVWRKIVAAWDLDDCTLIILKIACEAYDRLQNARRTVDKEGLTVITGDNNFIREHPALKVEKEAGSRFLQAWRMLDIETAEELGRPIDTTDLQFGKIIGGGNKTRKSGN